jgi:transposase-like protein
VVKFLISYFKNHQGVKTMDIKDYSCNNEQCRDFGKLNNGNIATKTRYGPNKQRILLYCRSCRKTFSASRNTALFGAHLPKETIRDIIHHTAEGVGVRATGRLLKLSKDTVNNVILRIGEHCEKMMSNMLKSLDMQEIQLDELWAFVKKKLVKTKKTKKSVMDKNGSGQL